MPPKSANQTPKVAPQRPLRVEVRNKNDRSWVLRNAKFLARTYNQPGVRIAKCLTSAEMKAIKDLKIECSKLNKSCANLSNGKKRYVVIDDRIMKRQDNGKLSSYQAASSLGASSASGASYAAHLSPPPTGSSAEILSVTASPLATSSSPKNATRESM